MIAAGDKAPDFTLPSQSGEEVRLSELYANSPVVLFFYPKDRTAGCTAEVCAFRDSYEVFQEKGAQVVGISSDSVESHSGFAGSHELPFLLLSDAGGRVRKSYGVRPSFGIVPGRVTFVIDRTGTIRHVFNSQLRATAHVGEALRILEEMYQQD